LRARDFEERDREQRKGVPEVVLVSGLKNGKKFFAERGFQDMRTECPGKNREKTGDAGENQEAHGAKLRARWARQ